MSQYVRERMDDFFHRFTGLTVAEKQSDGCVLAIDSARSEEEHCSRERQFPHTGGIAFRRKELIQPALQLRMCLDKQRVIDSSESVKCTLRKFIKIRRPASRLKNGASKNFERPHAH